MSMRNRTKVLAEPVSDYLSDTQALTYMSLTSELRLPDLTAIDSTFESPGGLATA